jgi:hypothetical protein
MKKKIVLMIITLSIVTWRLINHIFKQTQHNTPLPLKIMHIPCCAPLPRSTPDSSKSNFQKFI